MSVEPPQISVVVPTHNPAPDRLARVLAGLAAQTLPADRWELVVIDNASATPLRLPPGASGRVMREPALGLSAARRRGFREARGEFLVLVDDDNVLGRDYLERVLALFAAYPRVGAIGGRIVPEFATAPDAWVRRFDSLLACRDLGATPRISQGLRPPGATRNEYPAFAPVGAGMALRRAAAAAWLGRAGEHLPDRRGAALTSGGDNEIVFAAMQAGWEVGYFPELQLTHLIPAARTTQDYLGRLNEAVARSWVQVLRQHDACPWAPIAPWTVPLRAARAWFVQRAWSGPGQWVAWRGACGHFAGLARPS